MKHAALIDLARLSTKLARDPLLVQASGGNSSVKIGRTLWIKASGCWLADAERHEIFVPVVPNGAQNTPATSSLRPSIETHLHQVMPHRFVVHLHAVNSCVAALRSDAAEFMSGALNAFQNALFQPYQKPGAELANEVAAQMDKRPVDLVLLQNHGLVVGADSAEQAFERVAAVESALAPDHIRPANQAATEPAPAGYQWLPTPGPLVHGCAVWRLLSEPFMPDQIVLFSGEVQQLAKGEPPDEAAERNAGIILAAGRGLYFRETLTEGQKALLPWLVEIARRIPDPSLLNPLNPGQAAILLGWEAEHYRQHLDRARS